MSLAIRSANEALMNDATLYELEDIQAELEDELGMLEADADEIRCVLNALEIRIARLEDEAEDE